MKVVRTIMAAVSLLVLSSSVSLAQEFPKPGPEHAWLQKFVGDWEVESKTYMEPGQPPVVSKGSENIRPLGEFWTVAEVKNTMMGKPFLGNLTLGYDAMKQKYVGTWIDNITGQLQQYEGVVSPDQKSMVLESEGYCPMQPGKLIKFRESVEIKSLNETVSTSSMQGEDGQWVTMVTSHARRKK